MSAIKQGCREQKADQQLAGAEAAGSVLGEYLTLAGSKYTLPEVVSMELPAAGSSVPWYLLVRGAGVGANPRL